MTKAELIGLLKKLDALGSQLPRNPGEVDLRVARTLWLMGEFRATQGDLEAGRASPTCRADSGEGGGTPGTVKPSTPAPARFSAANWPPLPFRPSHLSSARGQGGAGTSATPKDHASPLPPRAGPISLCRSNHLLPQYKFGQPLTRPLTNTVVALAYSAVSPRR